MPDQPTHVPARSASGDCTAVSQARLVSAVATLRDALAPDVALDVPAVLDRSTLLDVLSVLSTNVLCSRPVPAPGSPVAAKPPRLNFAGYCTYCAAYACQSPACIRKWSSSLWGACVYCNGSGYEDIDAGIDNACANCRSCVSGVMEISPGTAEWAASIRTVPAVAP